MTEYEALLSSVLTGRIPVAEGERGLRAFADLDFHSNPSYLNYHEPRREEIEITPEHVRVVLRRYLAGELDERALRDWCQFITMVPSFRAPAPPPDDEDWFDPMWDTVHDFAMPHIFVAISVDSVRDKLAQMKRFWPDEAPRAV